MIFDRVSLLIRAFGDRRIAHKAAARWVAADERDPQLKRDIIRMSGLLAEYPERFEDGMPALEPVDPVRLGILWGRQQFARELLALMNTTADEMADMMEE